MAGIVNKGFSIRGRINRGLLFRVVGYGRPYKGLISGVIGLILLGAVFSALQPLLLRQIVDHALPQRNISQLIWPVAGMVVLAVVGGLAGILQSYLSSRIGEGITYDLRCALYQHLQQMSLRFFTGRRTGELMSRFNNDVLGARRALTSTLFDACSRVITVVITLVAMFALDWRLTLIITAAFCLLLLLFIPAGRIAQRLRQMARTQYTLSAEMNVIMNETLNVDGALFVRIFDLGDVERQRFFNLARRLRDNGVRTAMLGRWFYFGLGLLGSLGSALVIGAGGLLILSFPTFTLGTLFAFMTYAGQLYGPVRGFLGMRIELTQALVSFERVFELLDIPQDIKERPNATVFNNVRGRVSFENVSFSYSAGEAAALLARLERQMQVASRTANVAQVMSADVLNELDVLAAEQIQIAATTAVAEPEDIAAIHPDRSYALKDISLCAEQGQIVALVGPSGAGKTTLTYLLLRLYDPTSGRITIDEVDIRDVTIASLSRQIGMVTQETYLFHETIRANLLYARPDATDEALQTACKAAYIHDLVMSLPQGYNTIVGERGYRLSGGEKQRIAIARLLLKDPRILVLDEATSSLDSQSERLIQSALERLMLGRTTIIIAHRLSTVLSADTILVLDKGKLVEQGKHAELLARGGLYADLYRTQFGEQTSAQAKSL